MNELIPIIENEGKQAINARTLHGFLESKQEFANWMRNRIKVYGLIEGADYMIFESYIKNPNGGRPSKDYALTLSCAKELSMVEGNKKGKAARLYFIDCERKLRENSLLQRVATLEVQMADLRKQLVAPRVKIKLKQLPIGVEADLVAKHFAAPKHDEHTKFMSCMEITNYIKTVERINVGPYRIAKAVIHLTGQKSSFLCIGSHSVKRGYWLQTLTSL